MFHTEASEKVRHAARPSSPTSGHSLNSLYRIIVFLTCDARKNIDFSQLELADHGGRRLIRIVGGEVEQRSTLAADLCRDDAHAKAYTEVMNVTASRPAVVACARR